MSISQDNIKTGSLIVQNNEYKPVTVASNFIIELNNDTSGKTVDGTDLMQFYTLSFQTPIRKGAYWKVYINAIDSIFVANNTGGNMQISGILVAGDNTVFIQPSIYPPGRISAMEPPGMPKGYYDITATDVTTGPIPGTQTTRIVFHALFPPVQV